jgi:transposase
VDPVRAKVRALDMHLLYVQGLSLAEIAERYGLSPGRVSQIFRDHELPTRPAHARTETFEWYPDEP